VQLHQHADQDAGGQLHVRQVVGAERGDELRARDRLEDVVRRHREERVGEHQQRGCRFALAELDDLAGEPFEERILDRGGGQAVILMLA
jgi:hypothetical protein